jgi:hypothetical protein
MLMRAGHLTCISVGRERRFIFENLEYQYFEIGREIWDLSGIAANLWMDFEEQYNKYQSIQKEKEELEKYYDSTHFRRCRNILVAESRGASQFC